eukprot:363756-Chlamydomonas_euryale.AAC.2
MAVQTAVRCRKRGGGGQEASRLIEAFRKVAREGSGASCMSWSRTWKELAPLRGSQMWWAPKRETVEVGTQERGRHWRWARESVAACDVSLV